MERERERERECMKERDDLKGRGDVVWFVVVSQIRIEVVRRLEGSTKPCGLGSCLVLRTPAEEVCVGVAQHVDNG